MNIRPARVGDVPAIHDLIRTFADRKLMIRRSLGELYESIREFFVATDDSGKVIGCSALHVFWDDLATGCARAAAHGFDAVEIFPRTTEDLNARQLKQLLKQHKLKLAAMGTGAGRLARGVKSTPQEIRDTLKEFRDAGVDHYMLMPTVPNIQQFDRLADVVAGS